MVFEVFLADVASARRQLGIEVPTAAVEAEEAFGAYVRSLSEVGVPWPWGLTRVSRVPL